MLNVIDAFGYPAKLVERHKDIKTIVEAKKILRQWMEDGDRFEILEPRNVDGKMVTPILIVCRDGEDMDIFGQLVR